MKDFKGTIKIEGSKEELNLIVAKSDIKHLLNIISVFNQV